MWVQSLGLEEPLEKEMAAHFSIAAWRIPIDRGAWRATVHGVSKSQTWLKGLSSSSSSRQDGKLEPFFVKSQMKIEKETFCSLTVAKLRKVQAGKSGDKGYFCFSFFFRYIHVLVHFISVAQSCPTICDPMNCSTPGLLSITNSRSSLRLTSIEPVMPSSHLILCRPLLLLPPNPSQHQSLFQWVNSSHEVAKVLEFQL